MMGRKLGKKKSEWLRVKTNAVTSDTDPVWRVRLGLTKQQWNSFLKTIKYPCASDFKECGNFVRTKGHSCGECVNYYGD